MESNSINEIIETLESKQRDAIAFSKKYKSRNQEDLHQYYEGANWSLEFALHLLKDELNNKN